jgi:hypothetical protein
MDIHLINDAGEKLVVANREFVENQLSSENKYSNYRMDVDWYLANGYMTFEDMIKSIEGSNR